MKGNLFSVGVNIDVDKTINPEHGVIYEALEALRGFDIEAPTSEVAEHYANVIVEVLLGTKT